MEHLNLDYRVKTGAIALVIFGGVGQLFAQDKTIHKATPQKHGVATTIIEQVEDHLPGFTLEEFYGIPVAYIDQPKKAKTVYKNFDRYPDSFTF